jgi:hypothetical protein
MTTLSQHLIDTKLVLVFTSRISTPELTLKVKFFFEIYLESILVCPVVPEVHWEDVAAAIES